MLSRLFIQNFALIEKIVIEFSPKLNVLTGETGAGKTILIDALRFVLGDRAESDRMGLTESLSLVEAAFEIQNSALINHPLLQPYLIEEEMLLVLRRERNTQGKTRCLVNDRVVTVSALKEIGFLLMDIHGQYDHQQLLDPAAHIQMIDRLGKTQVMIEQYQVGYADYAKLLEEKRSLMELSASRERELDLLKYQIDELEKADLRDESEEIELKTEHAKNVNSEKLSELMQKLLDALNDDEVSVSSILAKSFRDLSQLIKLDESAENFRSQLELAQTSAEELIRNLQIYREGLGFDPDRLKEIEERLDIIEVVKRKYGGSLPKVMEFYDDAKRRYDQLLNRDVYAQDIDKKIKLIQPAIEKLAHEISELRKKTARALKKTIEMELKDLGIVESEFECRIGKKEFGPIGFDAVEFFIRLNAGVDLLPLTKVISGGEASRVMLALKKALIKVDPVETLIFDEIDANIGGRLGTVTGQKLKEISDERQVLLITHLPQIASFADRHFKVLKKTRAGKTTTEYALIEGEERVRELAQMMSGKDETEISKKHAKEMLSKVSPK